MGKVKNHILDMYENPQNYSLREVARWSGYKWTYLAKRFIESFAGMPERGWTWHMNYVKCVSLEQDW